MRECDLIAEILDALRAAKTRDQLDQVAEKYREDVQRLYKNPEWRTRAVHIANLKALKLGELKS